MPKARREGKMSDTEIKSKHELAIAAEDAKRVIANAAELALRDINKSPREDHDLLIRIETKLEQALMDISEIKTRTTSRIDNLEQNKCNQKDHLELVSRIEHLENWKNWVLGTMVVASAVIVFMALQLWNHLIKG